MAAKVGLIALIDEATGYQDVRARDALRRKARELLDEARKDKSDEDSA